MPFNIMTHLTNPGILTPDIDFIISHYTNNVCQALTISYPTKQAAETVTSAVFAKLYNKGSVANIDGDFDAGPHGALHGDMMNALGVPLPDTLTNYHQHWVTHGREILDDGYLAQLLTALKNRQSIDNRGLQHLMTGIGD